MKFSRKSTLAQKRIPAQVEQVLVVGHLTAVDPETVHMDFPFWNLVVRPFFAAHGEWTAFDVDHPLLDVVGLPLLHKIALGFQVHRLNRRKRLFFRKKLLVQIDQQHAVGFEGFFLESGDPFQHSAFIPAAAEMVIEAVEFLPDPDPHRLPCFLFFDLTQQFRFIVQVEGFKDLADRHLSTRQVDQFIIP